MTKTEAWDEFQRSLRVMSPDSTDMCLPIDYPEECDVQDAFEWGWACGIKACIEAAASKPEKAPCIEIMAAVNAVLGKNFGLTKANRSYINARWQEGKKIEDFERVCRIKKAQWDSDPKMRMYLRPETLFSTKMDSYCNEEDPTSRQTTPNWM